MRFLSFFLVFSFSLAASAQPKPDVTTTKAESAAPAASSAFPNYELGSGAKYNLTVDNTPTEVTMAIVSRSDNRLVLEIYMKSLNDNAALQIKMWQQFHLKLSNGQLSIEKGIMKIPQIEKAQVFPSEYLQGYSGVQMRSFLIRAEKDLAAKKISTESVSANGQTFQAQHYKHTENGQSVEFWLSESAKPFGLVKMQSAGSQMGQNYKMTYQGPVSGYKQEIDPALAEPLNDTAKMFLPMLGPGLFRN